jgi:hypothetical protein
MMTWLWGRNARAQCCPYMDVDAEVYFIRNETKVQSPLQSMSALFPTRHQQECIRTRPQNPFAIASWLCLLLTQCHPFDVSGPLLFPDGFPFIAPSQGGDGPVTQMIASVPLVIAGSSMIKIDLYQRTEYDEGIRRVSRLEGTERDFF